MNEPGLKLPRNADDLLRDFPVTEPDFEAQAKAIEARLKGDVKDPGALLPPSAGLTLQDLLEAPQLAAEAGEPGPTSSVQAGEPPRAAVSPKAAAPPKSNFAEMARKSLQKHDDDATQMARELLAATAQSRRPSAEMVERVRAAGRASATTTPLPSSERGIDEAQRTSGVVARAEPAKPVTSHRGMVIGLVGGALALAACVALFIKTGQSEDPTGAALAAEKASAPAPAVAVKPLASTQSQASENVMTPEALAAAPQAAARADAKGAVAKRAGSGPGVTTAPSKAPAGASSQPEAVVLEESPEPSKAPPAAEAKAAPAAAPVPEPPLKPAQGSSGSVPLTPSAGAVSTALSSVRGGAQACLAGQTDPVTATVVFAADGHVLSVRAGGPSGPCIQAALSKARITPFAKDSFSATTTIRPP
jgi:hypothetical protein